MGKDKKKSGYKKLLDGSSSDSEDYGAAPASSSATHSAAYLPAQTQAQRAVAPTENPPPIPARPNKKK